MINAISEARAKLVEWLGNVGCNVYFTPPPNYSDACLFIGEGSPFVEQSEETIGAATIRFEINAYPAPSLDAKEQLKRTDALASKVLAALWAAKDVKCEGYSTITLADNRSRIIARLSVTLEYTKE